jgi:hypothetical protein
MLVLIDKAIEAANPPVFPPEVAQIRRSTFNVS